VYIEADMKDSKEYSKKIQKLYRSLKAKYPKPEPLFFEEPADAIVCGIIAEHLDEKAAESTMKRFTDYFVDLNDLRVARSEEVLEIIGSDNGVTRAATAAISKALGGIFDKYHKMSLEAIKKTGKRPAKAELEKMEGLSRFVIDFCMLTSLQAHAIPLTGVMVDYLKSSGLAHPDADEQAIEGFLAKQISARNGYEFYALLRREAETLSRKKTTKRKTEKKTTEKKTASKKKTTKKKTTSRKKTTKKKTRKVAAKK